MKSTADLIVEPPRRHLLQRQDRDVGSLGVPGPVGVTQEQPNRHVGWKLGGAPQAPMDAIERPFQEGHGRVDGRPGERPGTLTAFALTAFAASILPGGLPPLHVLSHRPHQGGGGLLDPLRIAVKGVGQIREQGQEALPRAAGPIAGGEVRPAEKRLAGGIQPDAHRPPTRAGQLLDRAHVHGVHVGTLLAVDLDRHVVQVEERRDLLILERLLLHDVTPVTGRVPDGQEDGSAEAGRLLEGLVAP